MSSKRPAKGALAKSKKTVKPKSIAAVKKPVASKKVKVASKPVRQKMSIGLCKERLCHRPTLLYVMFCLFAAIIFLKVGFMLMFAPYNYEGYTVAFVERQGDRSVVHRFNPETSSSREIFSSPHEITDVLVREGRYYFVTPFSVAFRGGRIILPRRCTGDGVTCKFGFVDGNLVYRRAHVWPMSEGYGIEIESYILNKRGQPVSIGSYAAVYPNLMTVLGQVTKMSFDFDEGFVSLARSAINPSHYIFAGRPGYSGFFTYEKGKFVRHDREGNEYVLFEEWGRGCFMEQNALNAEGAPRQFHVFRTDRYDIAFDARPSFENWLLRDRFWIIRRAACRYVQVVMPDDGDITLIPGRRNVIVRTPGTPFMLYSLRGYPIYEFSNGVSLMGFVK